MATRRARADLHGVLLLDKPAGLSSNAALQHARVLYGRPKAGHTGTLDPLASGLLPICFGEATKFGSALLEADKCYETTIRFGFESSTGDAEGELIEVAPPRFSDAQLDQALSQLTGAISQVPPMYSALKVDGAPLYRLAREGRAVERRARTVNVHRIAILDRTSDSVRLTVSCSKGTYVRVLGEDLGRLLGCGGYLTELRRTGIGSFRIEQAIPLGRLDQPDMNAERREALLMPVDALVSNLPRIDLSDEAGRCVANGRAVQGATGQSGIARLYAFGGRFLGLGEATKEGVVVPKRMVSAACGTV